MLTPKISIVVPVYKVSKYLKACIDSLINQSLKEIEIILVNDCSPDPEDEKICLAFQRQDERIRYVRHTENLGPGGARNTGIQHASSPYLAFLDGDDRVHPDMYQRCLTELIEGDYDLVECNSQMVSTTGNFIRVILEIKERKELSGNEVFDSLLEGKKGIRDYPWNKVWKKEFFLNYNLKFKDRFYYFEDALLVPQYLIHAKKAVLIPEVYHFYTNREDSLVGANPTNSTHIAHCFEFLDLLKDALSKQSVRTDWLDWYNHKYRLEITKCANRVVDNPAQQDIFMGYLYKKHFFQHLNYRQLRFVLNFMNGPDEKRLRLLFVEILAQIGLLRILKCLLRR